MRKRRVLQSSQPSWIAEHANRAAAAVALRPRRVPTAAGQPLQQQQPLPQQEGDNQDAAAAGQMDAISDSGSEISDSGSDAEMRPATAEEFPEMREPPGEPLLHGLVST